MMLEHILVLSAYLFFIGICGLITSRNIVRALMCLELILNSVYISFVIFSDILDNRRLRVDLFSISVQLLQPPKLLLDWTLFHQFIVTENQLVLTNPIF